MKLSSNPSTDELIEWIKEHADQVNDAPRSAAEAGLDINKVMRLIQLVVPAGEGRQKIAIGFFFWGLRIAQENLDPMDIPEIDRVEFNTGTPEGISEELPQEALDQVLAAFAAHTSDAKKTPLV